MTANAQRITPWESFERGGAALLVLRARNSRKHNASDEYAAAIWLAVARKAYGQDVCRSYLVKHQQPRTWGMVRVLW